MFKTRLMIGENLLTSIILAILTNIAGKSVASRWFQWYTNLFHSPTTHCRVSYGFYGYGWWKTKPLIGMGFQLRFFEKIPWYGESIIYPHEAAKFVSTLVHVDEIYADHELLAALCIYHMRPDQYVFADARLEVNTKESLTNLREIRRLLNRDVSAGIALLETHGTGTKSLVFMNHTFFNPQLPSLLSNLAQSPDWVCVYSDSYSEDPGPSRFITGATVFVPRSVFTEAQLPRVSLDPLLVRLQN